LFSPAAATAAAAAAAAATRQLQEQQRGATSCRSYDALPALASFALGLQSSSTRSLCGLLLLQLRKVVSV